MVKQTSTEPDADPMYFCTSKYTLMKKQLNIRSTISKFPKAAENGGSNFLTHTPNQLTTAILVT